MFRLAPLFVLAWLLRIANSGPWQRHVFYRLKSRLLWRYAAMERTEVQRIRHECWGMMHYPCGKDCWKCGGTGIYATRFYVLERWVWRGYVFHIPVGPYCLGLMDPEKVPVDIDGHISKSPTFESAEAELWLLLLTGSWRSLWYCLSRTRVIGAPWWFPLLLVQRVANWTMFSLFPRLRFWRRRSQCVVPDCSDDDIPF